MDLDAQPSRFQGSSHTLLPAFLRGAMLDARRARSPTHMTSSIKPPGDDGDFLVYVHLLVNAGGGWYAGYCVRSCSSSC